MRGEEAKLVLADAAQSDGGGEAAQQRRNGTRNVGEVETLLGLGQCQKAGSDLSPIGSEQAHHDRNHLRRTIGVALAQGERVAPRRLVVALRYSEFRRASLMVPQPEAREIGARRVLHAAHEILDRHRLVVVALEIEVHAPPEILRARSGSPSCG